MEKLITINHEGRVYANFSYEALKKHINKTTLDALISEQQASKILESRKKAYSQESDPLYLEWQYDQTPEKEQAWRDKVAEIKARYPLG